MSDKREATLELDGTTLSYNEYPGTGPTIIGVHGLSSSRADEDAGGYFDWSPSPLPEAITTIQQPVLLRPWTDDPSHPLATSERLHDLLPHSVLEIQQTPDDLRALGSRIATFFN